MITGSQLWRIQGTVGEFISAQDRVRLLQDAVIVREEGAA